MIKHISCIILCIILVAQLACTKNKVAADDKHIDASVSTETDESITVGSEQQNNAFCFKLWHELDHEKQNIFFSPYSINTALAMVYSGAQGQTAREIAEVMGYSLPMDKQHQLFAKYQKDLNAITDKKQAELNIANALFAAKRNAYRLIPDYLTLLQDSFNSELHTLDFAKAAQSAAFINRWIEDQTNNRIKDMVSERQIAQSNDGMVLVNAIYFKGNWLHKFPLESTQILKFFQDSKLSPDSAKNFEMMMVKSYFRYAELPGYQILELPYEEEELAMIFVLPDEIEDIDKDLNIQTWQDWMAALNMQEVRAYIPRFQVEESLNLVDHFQKLGMQDAFNDNDADFSGIMEYDRRQNLYIQQISHKAFLEIKEEGSEAAAATQVGFATSSMTPNPPKVFMANKPFLCMIVHKADNNILFMGKVVNPKAIKS